MSAAWRFAPDPTGKLAQERASEGEGKQGRNEEVKRMERKMGENENSVLITGCCNERRPVCGCSNILSLNTFKRKMEKRLLVSLA